MKTIGVLLLVVLLETVICRPDQALIEAKKKAAKDSRLVTRDDEFTCDNGNWIPGSYRCDGDNDCGDNSDEIGCAGCGDNEFKCHDGACISASYACDSWADCSQGEDDCGCGVCDLSEFQCSNDNCIPESYICDGDNDCLDNTDERGCSNMDKRAFLSALGLNKATKDKKAAELKRGKDTKRNLKHKKSELTTKTAGKKSDVEKVTNKKSRVDEIKHEVEEAVKSKIEK